MCSTNIIPLGPSSKALPGPQLYLTLLPPEIPPSEKGFTQPLPLDLPPLDPPPEFLK